MLKTELRTFLDKRLKRSILSVMITIYTKTGCPFCHHVLAVADGLPDGFEEKNIANETYLNELLEKGGKRQVPFLVDSDKNVSMYESSEIIDYLTREYNIAARHDDTAQSGGGVCPI